MTASLQLDGRTDTTFPTGGQASLFLNLMLAGLFAESYTDNVTAHAGGGQAAATALTTELSRITTVATSGDSVKLPPSFAGGTVIVVNHTTNTLQVFGAGTDMVDDVATATGVSQMPNSTCIYTCFTAGNWYTEGLASGFVRGLSLQTMSSAVFAANATNTQAAGTPITAMSNQISAAAASYASTLPPSSPGMEITVHNVSAFATNVYPNALNNLGAAGSETINALSANAPLSFPANTSTTFYCNIAGQWYTAPRVPS
jgi:hypothetical protein